jgi:hypothetical protein
MNTFKFIIDCKFSNNIFPRNDVGLEMMGVILFQNVIESLLYVIICTTRLDIVEAMGIMN